MGLFDKIGEARVSQNANYLSEGRYWLRTDAAKIKKDADGNDMFVLEVTVVKVLSEGGAHRVGEEASDLTKNSGPSARYFLPAIKSVIVAGFGVDESQVTPAECEMLVSEEQPLAGVVLEYFGKEVETKKSVEARALREDLPPKYVTKRHYSRAVPFAELYEGLSEEDRNRFFPGLDWAAAIEAEKSA